MVLTAYSTKLDLVQWILHPWVLLSTFWEKDGQSSFYILFLLLHLQCIQLGAQGNKYISLEILMFLISTRINPPPTFFPDLVNISLGPLPDFEVPMEYL